MNGTWQLAAPAEPRTDAVAIDSLVTRVAGAQMKSLAPGADLKEYGLDKPSVTARIGTGSSHATLLIGKTGAEGTVYAKDESRPAVFTLESAIADELKKDALQYRQKDLFDATGIQHDSHRVDEGRGQVPLREEDGKGQGRQGRREVAAAGAGAERCRCRQDRQPAVDAYRRPGDVICRHSRRESRSLRPSSPLTEKRNASRSHGAARTHLRSATASPALRRSTRRCSTTS